MRRFLSAGAVIMALVLVLTSCGDDGPSGEGIASEKYLKSGDRYLKKGRLEKAISEYRYAIILVSGNSRAYTHRGIAYDRLGQHQRAIQVYPTVALAWLLLFIIVFAHIGFGAAGVDIPSGLTAFGGLLIGFIVFQGVTSRR